MEIFYSVALLIVAAIIANILYTIFPRIPLTFYQIGCGFLLTLLPLFRNYSLYPEFFMVGIIAPLMFNDGRTIDTGQMANAFAKIMSMAVYLAILTTIVIGTMAHAVMAVIPLALCLALAAIVTPTDSLALSSITENVTLPKAVSGALGGESLFNDASGIVVLSLALSAYQTGDFSFSQGLLSFIVNFFGGLLVGLIVGSLFFSLQSFLVGKSMDTASVIVPFSLMIPFAIYLISEELGCSGILAVVAGGLIYGINQSRLKLMATNVRLVTNATWGILSNLLNGIVFVLLGVTLPTVIVAIIPLSSTLILELSGLALLIYLTMGVVRFAWAKLNLVKIHGDRPSTFKEAFLIAVGGVHGTITLAMALSLPVTLAGHAFPYRDQLIFVATVVILLSLIIPAIVLPRMLPAKQVPNQDSFNHHRSKMVDYSIARIKELPTTTLADRNYVIDMLTSQKKSKRADKKAVRDLMAQTHDIEIQATTEVLSNDHVPEQFSNELSRRIALHTTPGRGFWKRIKFMMHLWLPRKRRFSNRLPDSLNPAKNPQLVQKRDNFRKQIETAVYERVNAYLDSIETPENTATVTFVRTGYNFRHARFGADDSSDDRQNQLLIQAFQYEYTYVADAFKNQKISRQVSDQLNQSITTDQMVYMADN